jgi:hypothetical protein
MHNRSDRLPAVAGGRANGARDGRGIAGHSASRLFQILVLHDYLGEKSPLPSKGSGGWQRILPYAGPRVPSACARPSGQMPCSRLLLPSPRHLLLNSAGLVSG